MIELVTYTLVLWFAGQQPIILQEFSTDEESCRIAIEVTKAEHPAAAVTYEDCRPYSTERAKPRAKRRAHRRKPVAHVTPMALGISELMR